MQYLLFVVLLVVLATCAMGQIFSMYNDPYTYGHHGLYYDDLLDDDFLYIKK